MAVVAHQVVEEDRDLEVDPVSFVARVVHGPAELAGEVVVVGNPIVLESFAAKGAMRRGAYLPLDFGGHCQVWVPRLGLLEVGHELEELLDEVHGMALAVVVAVSYTHLTLPTNREV